MESQQVLQSILVFQLLEVNMPFIKLKKGKGRGKYKSPSGRVFTKKQVKLYHASNGFKKKRKPKR